MGLYNSSASCCCQLRACLHRGGGLHIGEVTCCGSPLLSCITKRNPTELRDYVDRRVTHQSGLPHLPGAPHLHVNRPYTSSPDGFFSFLTSYLDLVSFWYLSKILLSDPILTSHHKESDPVIQPFVCHNHLCFSPCRNICRDKRLFHPLYCTVEHTIQVLLLYRDHISAAYQGVVRPHVFVFAWSKTCINLALLFN